MAEILRVVGARFVGDPQISAEERSTEFGNKFLHGVCAVGETLAELAVATRLMARPVGQFVQQVE